MVEGSDCFLYALTIFFLVNLQVSLQTFPFLVLQEATKLKLSADYVCTEKV